MYIPSWLNENRNTEIEYMWMFLFLNEEKNTLCADFYEYHNPDYMAPILK